MHYIKLTPENLDAEHICCAISNNKDPQVACKKAWLRARMEEGLIFLKAEARGKCFIEYMPAESAWVPIEARGYMHINCHWVSGSLKGHGYADDLLEACIADSRAKGRSGITAISSSKKRPYLSDPKYLSYKGFQMADTAQPFFTLYYLPFENGAPVPQFKASSRIPRCEGQGFALYYTEGCPFTAKYVPLIEQAAQAAGYPFTRVLIDSREKAQSAPAAWTNYALFYDGQFVTNEILSEKKFMALAEELLGNRGAF